MNLIIDIGNTQAKIAVFDELGKLVETMHTNHTLAGVAEMAQRYYCTRGIVSTTAGISEEAEREIGRLPFDILRMTGETATPLRILYHTPKTLGTDRLAAVVGAWAESPGRSLLVIDAGTCVTYDLLDHEGNYRGGNISPGLEMRLHAMHDRTARLPLINAKGDTPEVGYDTETALRSGAIMGLKMEIEGYIRHFRQKYSDVLVFLTGGDAHKLDISAECCIFARDFVVLYGLNTILAYNK